MMDHRVECVYGATGSGKSTCAKALLKDRPKVVVFDPMGEYGGRKGWISARTIEDAERAMARQWARGPVRVAYVCPSGREDEAAALADLCWRAQGRFPADPRPLTLVLEEANRAYPNKRLPPSAAALDVVTLQGRHRGISLLVISQRPALISTDLRGQATRLNVFQLPGPHDRRAVDEVCDGVAGPLRSLARYEFIRIEGVRFERWRTLKNGEIRKKPVRT